MNFSFLQQYQHPSRKTLGILLGLFCAVPLVVFLVLPSCVGYMAEWTLGWGSIPFFLSRHAWAFALVQDLLRGVYVAAAVGGLDFLLLVLVYRLLDDAVTRQGKWRGVLAVAARAWGPLLWRQACVGLVLCVALWKVEGFSSLYLLPEFFSADFFAILVLAVWSVSAVVFGCAFAVTEQGSAAVRFSRLLLKAYFREWIVAAVVTCLLAWLPAVVLSKFGVTGESAGLSVFFILHGSILFLAWWSVFLIWLFNKPDVFALAPSAEE